MYLPWLLSGAFKALDGWSGMPETAVFPADSEENVKELLQPKQKLQSGAAAPENRISAPDSAV